MDSFVAITGFTINLIPSSNVINTEKLPIVVFGTRLAIQLPNNVNARFVYEMLGIPQELYTAMFAVARIVGWSAHRIEELICTDKIIRPAYMSVMEKR